MQYRILNKINIKISEISLGCWTMGGLNFENGYSSGWGNVNQKEIEEAVLYAIDNGVNHFDNADCYGDGASEKLLGKILENKKNNVIISSKVGYIKNNYEHAYVSSNIIAQCEKSLKNLNRDYIDIYYFHHGNFGENDKYLDEAVKAMYKLKKSGKIKFIGLSAYTSSDFVRLVPKIKPDVLQSWANVLDNKFIAKNSLVDQVLEKEKISFIAFSPLAKGLLLGKYSLDNIPVFEDGDHRKGLKQFSREYLEIILPKIELLKKRFGKTREELARMSLQYILYYKNVGCVIPGFRNIEQVKMNIEAAGKPLNEEDVKYINEVMK